MRVSSDYIIRNLQGGTYLLPIGQSIATQKRSIQLNSTSTLLWNALKQGMNEKELLELLIREYPEEAADLPSLQSDIDNFIKELISYGIIFRDEVSFPCNQYFSIGNIVIGYHGPESLLHPSLMDFASKPDMVDQDWYLVPCSHEELPTGKLIIRTHEIEIFKDLTDYTIIFNPGTRNMILRISQDGKKARFYYMSPFHTGLSDQLFHAYRTAFLIVAQKKGIFALHSSSFLYRDKVWLISAPSGTGKTTHTSFWHEVYQAPIINGDINLISMQGSTPMVWGLPWCGTSGQYSNLAYPLGGIALIKQHGANLVQPLSREDQQLLTSKRLLSPSWTEEMLDDNLAFSSRLMEYVPIFNYLCKNEASSAEVLRQYLDEVLKE